MSYKVKLNVFEGPFDLLVYLIEHARMSIYDIRISEITNQYMDYVEHMKEADVSVSSEFMVLAAALLEIKSRMLLPRDPSKNEGSDITEDPRTELVEKLVEYKRFKAASEMLQEREEKAAMSLEKPREDLNEYIGEPDEYLSLDIEQFKAAFEKFLVRKKKLDEIRQHHRRTEKQRVTTEIRMSDIKEFFIASQRKEAEFKELIKKKNDKYDVAVTFSSLLEMMKQRCLDADQKYIYGDITVRATEKLFAKEAQAEGEAEEAR